MPIDLDIGVSPVTPERTIPRASPVDTYVRPPVSSLSQLADSLKEFAPEVGRFGSMVQNIQNEKDTTEGESAAQEAIRQGAKDWKDAISKNLVDPSRSPYYKAAIQEQFGRNAGGAFTREWELSAAQNATLQMSWDPQDYDNEFQKFAKDWTNRNIDPLSLTGDQHFRSGFDTVVNQTRNSTLTEATRLAAAKMKAQAGSGFFSDIMQTGDLATQNGWTPDVWANIITAHAQIMYNANPKNGTMLSQKAADGIAAYAEATGDLSKLEAMKSVDFGSGTLFNTQYGQQVYQATKNKIVESQIQMHRLAIDQKEEQHAAAVATLNTDLMGTLGSVSPKDASSLDLTALKVRAIALMGPEGGKHVDEIQQAVVNQNTHDDAIAKRDIFVNIWNPDVGTPQTTESDITTAFRNNQLTFASAQALLGDLSKQEKGTSVSYSKDPLLKQALAQLKDLYVTNSGDTETQRVHLWQAEHQLSADYIDWSEHGAGKGLQGKERDTSALSFLQQKSEEELHRIGSAEQTRTLDKQPARTPPGAPGHVDWHKAIAADPSSIRMVHNELWKFQNHFQNDLSPAAWGVLHAAGVGKLEEVKDFLDSQEKISPSLVQNPWKPPTLTVQKP